MVGRLKAAVNCSLLVEGLERVGEEGPADKSDHRQSWSAYLANAAGHRRVKWVALVT